MRPFAFVAGAIVVAIATITPASAAAAPPDVAARTPVARSHGATATASISRATMCSRLKSRLRRGGQFSGLFVIDAGSGKAICRKAGRTRRIPASNMKLFTTAAALGRFGADARLESAAWSVGDLDSSGTLQGSLYLVGGGDPTLASPGFGKKFLGSLRTDLFDLTEPVQAAGIDAITGRVYADDTIFDRLRGVADSGFRTSSYIGPLSGLNFNLGYADSGANRFASDPARLAAGSLAGALRSGGVDVPSKVGLRALPSDPTRRELGTVSSPRMETLVNATDVNSNNFFAEMLLKDLGARFGSGGTTRAGAKVSKRFARKLGTGVRQVDGSGLSRGNRVTPAQVARLLLGMLGTDSKDAFVNALPLAGREGTVASRMRGTAAEGRCRTKTGTLTGVSALSGYCFNADGKVMAFSILNNGVSDLYQAHVQQDRMAALIARY